MKQRSTYIALIAFVLDLSLSTSAISLKRDQNIQPDKLNTKWIPETSASAGFRVWKTLGLSSLSSEVRFKVSNSETRISFSEIESQFTYSDGRDSDEAKGYAHVFHESLQEGLHHRKHSTKQRVKRALEGMFNGGRSIEDAAQAAKAAKAAKAVDTISDLNKAREVSGSSKALSGADAAKLGKADSFRGTPSRLEPVPVLTKSKSLPSSSSSMIDQKATLKAINTRFDKSVFELTDGVMTRERPPRTPLIAALLENVNPEIIMARQKRLTLDASFALYAEKDLYQAVIDGNSDMKTIQKLVDILDKQRGAYVKNLEESVKFGIDEKMFLNYNSIQETHSEVISLRKMTSGNEINPSRIQDAKKPPTGTKISFPKSLTDDEKRGTDIKSIVQKPPMQTTFDEVSHYLYSPESTIEIFPAKDASIKKVKDWANAIMERDYIFETSKTRANYKLAQEARTQYQWYLQSYLKQNGVNWSLVTDVQEIFNRRGIPLTLRTPPKSKVLVWYGQFKSKYQMSMYKLRSMFKTALGRRVQPVSASPVRSP